MTLYERTGSTSARKDIREKPPHVQLQGFPCHGHSRIPGTQTQEHGSSFHQSRKPLKGCSNLPHAYCPITQTPTSNGDQVCTQIPEPSPVQCNLDLLLPPNSLPFGALQKKTVYLPALQHTRTRWKQSSISLLWDTGLMVFFLHFSIYESFPFTADNNLFGCTQYSKMGFLLTTMPG